MHESLTDLKAVIISHGHSNGDTIYNAIRVACECLQSGVVEAIKEEIARAQTSTEVSS